LNDEHYDARTKSPAQIMRSGFDILGSIVREYFGIIVIVLAATIAFFWVQSNEMLVWTDWVWYPDAVRALTQSFFLWESYFTKLGVANYKITPAILPRYLYAAVAQELGIPEPMALRWWIFLINAGTGLSAYYLVNSFFTGSKAKVAGMIAGLVYMFNPFALIWLPATEVWYAFLPLELGMFVRGVEKGKGGAYAFWICIVTLVTTTSIFSDPQFLLVDIGAMLFYLVIYCVARRGQPEVKRALLFTLYLAVSFIILNMFWLLPDIVGSEDSLVQSLAAYATSPFGATTPTQIIDLNSASSFYDAIRLLGYWALGGGVTLPNGTFEPYFSWFQAYSSSLLVTLATLLLPILSFAMAFRIKDRRVAYFVVLAVIGLILEGGTTGQFGFVYSVLIRGIPLFEDLFKVPYLDFGPYVVLSFSVLAGLFVLNFILPSEGKASRKRIVAVAILLIVVVGVAPYPMWTGEVMNKANSFDPHTYQFPAYYAEAKNWLGRQGSGFNTISLPYEPADVGAYRWHNYSFYGTDPTISYLGEIAGEDTLATNVVTTLLSNPTTRGGELLSLINVRYVIVHNDTDWSKVEALGGVFIYPHGSNFETNPVGTIEAVLQENGLVKVTTIGRLIIYENMLWTPKQVWATSKLTVASDENTLFADYLSGIVTNSTAVLLKDQNNELGILGLAMPNSTFNQEQLPNSARNIPITYSEISPVEYEVNTTSAEPFVLILSQNFDNGWDAYVNGVQIPQSLHFTVNGYCNAWLINETGTLNIKLYFAPQNYLYYGSAVTIAGALLLLVLFVIFPWRKKKK
jgi:hypothetical protein